MGLKLNFECTRWARNFENVLTKITFYSLKKQNPSSKYMNWGGGGGVAKQARTR